jgi:vanillate O-demethylase ferredoxin subunit
MVQRLEALGRPWKLFYGARSRSRCAYLDELLALEEKAPGRVQIHINDEHGGAVMDMAATVASVPADAHLYCCGPAPMLKAFEAATAGRPEDHVHVEYFSAAQPANSAGGFSVVLSRAKRTVFVEQGKSILDALLGAGLDVSHCCKEGVCGACQTTVIEGQPDHRDAYLSPAERRSGKTIMLCCSGSLSKDLVLDL